MPFVFYDAETTGLNTSFDQILQFGAAGTNDDLEIEDPKNDVINVRCRRLAHVVPSPQALEVTPTEVEAIERLLPERSVPWTTISTVMAELEDYRRRATSTEMKQYLLEIEHYLHELPGALAAQHV